MERIGLSISEQPAVGLAISEPAPVRLSVGEAGASGDYSELYNKPSIESHVLVGDSTLEQIGVGTITPQDIDRMIYG